MVVVWLWCLLHSDNSSKLQNLHDEDFFFNLKTFVQQRAWAIIILLLNFVHVCGTLLLLLSAKFGTKPRPTWSSNYRIKFPPKMFQSKYLKGFFTCREQKEYQIRRGNRSLHPVPHPHKRSPLCTLFLEFIWITMFKTWTKFCSIFVCETYCRNIVRFWYELATNLRLRVTVTCSE